MYLEEYTVRFYETDALQHVSNTVLAGWFEAARLPIFKLFSPNLNLQSWPLILASYKIDFVAQIYLQGPVQIKTWIDRIGNSSFDVYQECWQENELKSKGITTLVHFDYASKKAIVIPQNVKTELDFHLLDRPQTHRD